MLLVGIAGLVLVAVASVLTIGLTTSRQNTYDLLRSNAETAVGYIVGQVHQHLDAPRQQAEFLAQLVASSELSLEDKPRLADTLYAALAGTPQVAALAVLDTAGQAFRVTRSGAVLIDDWSADARVRNWLELAGRTKQSFWGELVREGPREGAFINLRMPLWRGGNYVGIVASVVSVGELSRYLSGLATAGSGVPFILLGRDQVLAHPNLGARSPELAPGRLLPELDAIGDPVIAAIWSSRAIPALGTSDRPGALNAHVVQNVVGADYVFLYRQIGDYGDTPWYVGTYFALGEVDRELERLWRSAIAGAAVLVLSILAALAMARWLGRPIRMLAKAAESVRDLDFTASGPAAASSIRELDDAATAFNQMLAGLRWFETYVPRALVTRLMRESQAPGAGSEERMMTVLFTDITGFTTMAEQMGAAEVASLLNHHFTMINRCVEAEEGIVDKYIGDSVMSFWNAPSAQPDHALRGLRAARAIARAVDSDNRVREADGLQRLRMRIGLHSGLAVVGNIGSPGRINFTIVGDTVNAAARIVSLGRQVEAEVAVLASSDTVEQAGLPARELTSLGLRNLRGRSTPIEVFQVALEAPQ
ncbi:MAG: HAMP domain-containing protein [Proteobacteria bacterium]|nr:HAMP domain-containing protein [Pseudomonadota bacterium]